MLPVVLLNLVGNFAGSVYFKAPGSQETYTCSLRFTTNGGQLGPIRVVTPTASCLLTAECWKIASLERQNPELFDHFRMDFWSEFAENDNVSIWDNARWDLSGHIFNVMKTMRETYIELRVV